MRIAASGRTINAPPGAVINRGMGVSFMKIKSFLATAILLGAVFGLGRPESQTGAWAGARSNDGASAEASYESKTPGALTFNKDIAPIIFNNCASCHRPNAVAPFSLLSYQDVKKRAKQIAYVTEKRIMPPWKPDLIVKMGEAYSVPADGPDIYRNFALPLDLAEDKWVKAIEFRPGARSVVHHSLFFYDATGSARKQDEEDPLPGYSGGMGGLPRCIINLGSLRRVASGQAAPVGGLGGWAVGAQARALPEGLAWYLPKDADLILSTHFHPSGKPEMEESTVGVYFADRAPTKKFTGIQLPPLFGVFKGIDIPAGAKEYAIEDSFTLPVDVKAFGASAHAHYLAKQMKLTARLPGGQTRTLLWISDWDFAWQDQYQFKEFVSLPKGTRLDVKITYDNSADNPRNPASPPKGVRWGEGSNDEMGSMGLAVVAADEAEMPQLQQAYRQHLWSALTSKEGLSSLRNRANSGARQ